MNHIKNDRVSDSLALFEKLIALSVDLHNLNAGVQKNYQISIVQWLVLKKIIDNPGISAGGLADNSGVHPSTLTPTINRLEALGHIYILERPSDLRRKFIVGSWSGFDICAKSEQIFEKILGSIQSDPAIHEECDRVRIVIRDLLSLI